MEDRVTFEASNRSRLVINIVPLVDIVFLLLIFFMLASSFLKQEAIELRLPGPEQVAAPSEDFILVGVEVDGSLTLNGVGLPLDRLMGEIKTLLASDPAQPVTIWAVREVPVQRVVQVMDRARGAGAKNIGVVTKGAPAIAK